VAESNTMEIAVEPAEVAARYRRLAAAMTARVNGVGGSGWEQPSPCAGWTARDVLRHVVEVQRWPLEAAGAGVDDIPSSDADVVAAWDAASSKLAGLLDDAGKAAVEIEVAVAGWMSAAAAVNLIVCGDLTVHTWDLARATGQDEHLDPAEVASMRAAVDAIGMEKLRRFGLYSSALIPPSGADAQTELLAYLGRRAW
jgi:uncharacterized protein (TIGR03086 family)